ncbi:hypothetical protein AB3U99_11365 [Niallia sp. JL1B1071]|uniref:hypothetical protein n=1 Tax=Niallia tiangongensis TaxID=3237105 RepID=UPI0037DD0D99
MIDEKQLLIRNDVLIDYLKGKEELNIATIDREFSISGKSARDISIVINTCNGINTVEDIRKETGFSLEYLEQIINFLKEKNIINGNFLQNETKGDNLENLLLITKKGSDITKDINRIRKSKVGVIGQHSLVSEQKNQLESIFEIIDVDELISLNSEKIDLLIVLNQYESFNQLKFVNEIAQENRIKYLRVNLNKEILEIGPLFIPKQTACYNCFLNRTISNLNYPEIYLNFIKKINNLDSQIKNYPDLQSMSVYIIKNYLVNYFAYNSYSVVCQHKTSIAASN